MVYLPEVMTQAYAEHYQTIVDTTTAFSMTLPEYQHLDWRIDVELGRRTVSQDATPKFMLRLDLAEGGEGRSLHLQSDYANMKHLLAQLEAAVAEERSVHARRFQRYIR
jgi:hypothetical protein